MTSVDAKSPMRVSRVESADSVETRFGLFAPIDLVAETKSVFDGSSNGSEYPRYDHRYALGPSVSQDAQVLTLSYYSRQSLGSLHQGVRRATGANNPQDNIAGQDILPRDCRRSGGHCANDELSLGVGVEHEPYRIEIIYLLSAGMFKETIPPGVVDLNSELAEHIASQRTNDSCRSFIGGGAVGIVWP